MQIDSLKWSGNSAYRRQTSLLINPYRHRLGKTALSTDAAPTRTHADQGVHASSDVSFTFIVRYIRGAIIAVRQTTCLFDLVFALLGCSYCVVFDVNDW